MRIITPSHVPRPADRSDRFRWAACQLDALSGCLNPSKLRQTLDSLPETLDETYDRILCKIDPLFKQEILRILQWLTCSMRPLSLEEVAEVVAFDIDNDAKLNPENRLAEPGDVLTLCSSLVTIIDTDCDDDEESRMENIYAADSTSETRLPMVRLAHFSVKEYLVSDRIRTASAAFFRIDEKVSNAVIGEISLSCLLLYDKVSFSDSEAFSKEFPLAKYSAQYWNEHLLAISGQVHPPPHPLAIELFLSEEKMRNWIALYNLDGDVWRRKQPNPKSSGSPLYYAVLTSLPNLVEALIEYHEGPNEQAEAPNSKKLEHADTNDGSAALQYTSSAAYVNATGGTRHTPLHAASLVGKIDIVAILIKHGADPNFYGGCEGGSALSAAAPDCSFGIVELLLDNVADLYEGIHSQTSGSLKEGSMGYDDFQNDPEHEDEVIDGNVVQDETKSKDELKPPVDALDRRTIEQRKRTALFEAASFGYAEMVSFMLDCGAMIDLRNGIWGETALIKASWNGHEEVVQILLERGALVDKRSIGGCTSLLAACINGEENIARMLLDRGADYNCTDKYGKCPIIDAIKNDNDRIV